MSTKQIERGAQTGAPPSLEQVAIERLQVDPTYQRAADGAHSRRLIMGMVREWKWALCQPLAVARREDGSLWILDGQHRHAGATARGDIAYLPCVILPTIGAQGEARTFLDLNTKRQNLSQLDIFLGMLAAGDEYARATAALLEETGWCVVRTRSTKNWKPGDLVCAPALASHVRVHGAEAVREALLTLRQAYPDDVVTAPASLLNALVEIYRPGSHYGAVRPKLVAAMAQFSADSWMAKAQAYRLDRPNTSIRDAMVNLLLPPTWLRQIETPAAVKVAPIAARPGAFDAEGRAWCGQCERRLTPASAANCKSQFCKVKAAA